MHSELQQRPFRELAGVCAAIIAFWMAEAFFIASNFVYNASAFAIPAAAWPDVLLLELCTAALWAVFTPIVAALAERLPLRRGHIVRSVFLLLAVIPLLALACTMAEVALLDPGAWGVTSIAVRMHFNILAVAAIAGITRMMDAHRDSAANERRAAELQTAVIDAEADRLRAQTQPSFLFGTLRAIRDRVRTDPGGADQMLVTLSELLRSRLNQKAGRMVPLEEELEMAERYFQLQQMHFRTSTAMVLDVEEDVLNAAVPAFALQTLLETAIGEQVPSSVIVRGHARGNVLALEARATPFELTPVAASDAEERLRRWFGVDRRTGIRQDGQTMIALVDLQLRYTARQAR